MVKVREDIPVSHDGSVDLGTWLELVQQKTGIENLADLNRAAQLALSSQQNLSDSTNAWAGQSCFDSGLEIVSILADLRMDQQSLISGLLYRAVREKKLALETVSKEFGQKIADLIEGVLRMAAISSVIKPEERPVLGQNVDQVNNLRRMLVAMVDDVRVALIKLAERTCAIRAVKSASTDKRTRVAREAFEIYAPLAHRLGIGHIKWELEDLSFRYLRPASYMRIARQLDERRVDRQKYIDSLVKQLKAVLSDHNIEAEVSGRAKHIYSIWRKMQRKKINFSQVYDIRAVRILVPGIRDCYSALGLVHATWQHIPREFDDYIATPKDNGYRSLHTAVLGPDSKVIEIQIRTAEMHDEAELGVCAHWHYKEGTKTVSKGAGAGYEDKIAWLRQVLEWHEELGESGVSDLVAQFKQDAIEERIYVFTRDGHVVDLAQNATPLDFAYHVHTEVGHRCRGAKVNGRIVPLNYTLSTGDQVDILTGKEDSPSKDWLNSNLGYIVTSRARAKIQHWFKLQNREQNIRNGREILLSELRRLSVDDIDLNEVVGKLKLKGVDDLFVAYARGEIKLTRILQAVQRALSPSEQDLESPLNVSVSTRSESATAGVDVQGVDELMSHAAGCCQPLPGDDVMGYISVGRGIIVHQRECKELQLLLEKEPQRVIEINWTGDESFVYPVDISLVSYDRTGLLRDVSSILADEKMNVINVNTVSDKAEHVARMKITVETPGLEYLGRLLTKLSRLPNVIQVKREH